MSAENLLLKQQLIIHSRSRQRAPNLTTQDRTILGFLSLFLNPRRITRAAIIFKPSTPLSFHNALKKRKYRLLYSPRGGRKPGPGGFSRQSYPMKRGRLSTLLSQLNNTTQGMDVLALHNKSIWRCAVNRAGEVTANCTDVSSVCGKANRQCSARATGSDLLLDRG